MAEQSDKKVGLFNVSIDTGVLFTMLIAAVYFGTMLRADLDHAITAIVTLNDKITDRNADMAKEIAELKQRIMVLENTLASPP